MRYSIRHLCLALFHAPVLVHATEDKFADPGAATTVSPAAGVAQSLLALLLVLGVLFAAAWLLRRFRMVGQAGGNNLKVIQGVSLGAKERAVLVHVHGRRLLLGVAPGQVTLLTEISNETSGDEATPPANEATSAQHSFKSIFKRSLGLQDK